MEELWKWYVPLQMLGVVLLLISVGSWNDILNVHMLGQNTLLPNKSWRIEFKVYFTYYTWRNCCLLY